MSEKDPKTPRTFTLHLTNGEAYILLRAVDDFLAKAKAENRLTKDLQLLECRFADLAMDFATLGLPTRTNLLQ